MNKGNLKKREISKLAGCWQVLDQIVGSSSVTPCPDEISVVNKLIDARNAVGQILRAQAFGTWQDLQKGKGGAA